MKKIIILVLLLLILSVKNISAVQKEGNVFQQEASISASVGNNKPFEVKISEIMDKLSFEILRQERILEKITLRLNKIKDQGIKTAKAEADLKKLSDKIDLLQKEYNKLTGSVDSLNSSENMKRDYLTFRKKYQITIKLLKDIVQTEKILMISLKKLGIGSIIPSISIKP